MFNSNFFTEVVNKIFNKRQNEIPEQGFPIHPTLAIHLSQNNTSQQFVACKHYIETKQSLQYTSAIFYNLVSGRAIFSKKKPILMWEVKLTTQWQLR